MRTALVMDGEHRAALAIVRSLGRHGISVTVGAEQPESLAGSSRYCAHRLTYPSPERHGSAFQQFLLDRVEREHIDVIVPVTDVTTHAVCLRQHELQRHTAVAVPPVEAFEFAASKWAVLTRAAVCGVKVPRTLFVANGAALDSIIDRVEYPAVIKPVHSRVENNGRWVPASVGYAASRTDLVRLYRETDYLANHPSLVQQRIVGPGIGVFALFNRGRLLTAFAHRRLREKPPSGGVSVLRESIPLDNAMKEMASCMLGPARWHGVAMLEFKQDYRSGDLVLMEVNGRFWGSLQLAVDAGIDFPYLTYQLARGRQPAVPPAYDVGVKSRWWLGDLDHLLLRLSGSGPHLNLPPDAPSRLRTLVDFVRPSGANVRSEVLRTDDPGPGLFEAREYLKALVASFGSHVRRAFHARTEVHARTKVRAYVR